MSILTDDQLARIRFAYRVWSTGNTYGAPAAAVRAAHELIDSIALDGAPTSQEAFTRAAKEIVAKSESSHQ